MDSKRIACLFVLLALLIACTGVTFASSDIDDSDISDDSIDVDNDLDIDESDYVDAYIDSIDDDLDDSEDDEDWEDDDLDDSEDDEDWEDWDGEGLDDSEDYPFDEDYDHIYKTDDGWKAVKEWDEMYENGTYAHIYKTLTYAKGKYYAASSCSYIPNSGRSAGYSDNSNGNDTNDTAEDEEYETAMHQFLAGSMGAGLSFYNKYYPTSYAPAEDNNVDSVSKSVSKSIDLSKSFDNQDDQNTSEDTNDGINNGENTQINLNDFGIFGLLLALIIGIILII